jgi:predicted nucleotidyltransferase
MPKDILMYRMKLLERLKRLVGSVSVDLVVLNEAPPVLRYEVIKYGRVIKEGKNARVIFETSTLSEYLDTEHLRNTQCLYLKEQLLQGAKHG